MSISKKKTFVIEQLIEQPSTRSSELTFSSFDLV